MSIPSYLFNYALDNPRYLPAIFGALNAAGTVARTYKAGRGPLGFGLGSAAAAYMGGSSARRRGTIAMR